ncbi:MAG: type II toxin-antitoxin system RelE/ParE family toxin, partial [Proteobacteria bacterium]|nr:type II toxin-antitoxin system RelE/ParE family toxin [Pseudomonadota bacterium]
MTIRLSRRAQKDLDEIRRFTVARWGRDQWWKNYRGLVRAIEAISANPEGGRARS